MDDSDADINTYCSILKVIYLFLDNNNLPKTAEAFMQEIIDHNENLKDVNFNDVPTRTVILRPQETDEQACKDCIICISNTPDDSLVVEELCTCIDKEDTAQKPNVDEPLEQVVDFAKQPSGVKQAETPKQPSTENVKPTEGPAKLKSRLSIETEPMKLIEPAKSEVSAKSKNRSRIEAQPIESIEPAKSEVSAKPTNRSQIETQPMEIIEPAKSQLSAKSTNISRIETQPKEPIEPEKSQVSANLPNRSRIETQQKDSIEPAKSQVSAKLPNRSQIETQQRDSIEPAKSQISAKLPNRSRIETHPMDFIEPATSQVSAKSPNRSQIETQPRVSIEPAKSQVSAKSTNRSQIDRQQMELIEPATSQVLAKSPNRSRIETHPTESIEPAISASSKKLIEKNNIARTSGMVSKEVVKSVSYRTNITEIEEVKNTTPLQSTTEYQEQFSSISKQTGSSSAMVLNSIISSECDLNYDLIKEHLITSDDLVKIRLLQALRWRLTKTNGEERDYNLRNYVNNDILFIKEGPLAIFESYLCPARTPNALQEAFARFIDTLASMSAGRAYLEYDYHPYQIFVLPVLMNKVRNVTINTLAKEFLLATVQKLSLSKPMRDIIIDCGGVEWLINNIQHYHRTVSDYEAEYSVALLMNLCLNTETGERCESLVDSVAELLMELLVTPHECCLYYLPGIFFALFMHSSIYKATMALGALSKLKDICKNSPNQYVYKQLETIFLMNVWENSEKLCKCDGRMSPDCYGDYLEMELDMNDFTFENGPAGEDLLKNYKIANYNPNAEVYSLEPKSCICKPPKVCGVDNDQDSEVQLVVPPPDLDSETSEVILEQLPIVNYSYNGVSSQKIENSSPGSQVNNNLQTQTVSAISKNLTNVEDRNGNKSAEKVKVQASISITHLDSSKHDNPANIEEQSVLIKRSQENTDRNVSPLEKPCEGLQEEKVDTEFSLHVSTEKKVSLSLRNLSNTSSLEKRFTPSLKEYVNITRETSSTEKPTQNEGVNARAEISILEKRASPIQKKITQSESPIQKRSSLVKAKRSTLDKTAPKCSKCKKKKLKSIEVVLKDSGITGLNINSERLYPSMVLIDKGVQTEVPREEPDETRRDRVSSIKEVLTGYPPILVPCRLSYYYYNKDDIPKDPMLCNLMPNDNQYMCRCFDIKSSSKEETNTRKPQSSIVGGRRASGVDYKPVLR